MQNTDAKSSRFAATGLRLSDQITSLQNHRQALGLDGRHLVITETIEITQ